jgi:hypothetical protein
MKTFTVNSASEVLERDRRTVARALRGVPPDHKDAQGHERWRLSVIIDALSANRGEGANAAVIDEILAAAEAVDHLLEQLRAAPDVEAARVILRAEGHRIGGLDRALSAGLAGLRPAEVQLLQTVRDHVVGAATGEALSLCRWQIAGAQETV